jgi:hypothetical protein
MPMLDGLARKVNEQFLPHNINDLAEHAAAFAPGRSLRFDLIYPAGSPQHEAVSAYFKVMPGSVKDAIRNVFYYALTQTPPVGVTLVWTTAAQFAASVAQYPPTSEGDGAIVLSVTGPFPSEVPSIWNANRYGYASGASRSKRSGSVAKRGSPRPAKRRPSTRSRKS